MSLRVAFFTRSTRCPIAWPLSNLQLIWLSPGRARQSQSTRQRTHKKTMIWRSRTLERLRPLASNGYVPQQQLDQAQVAEKDTATKLIQAQQLGAAAEATVRARTAALGIAQRQLDDTTVRATHNGLVVGLTVSTGEMVIPAQSLFTLINTDEWFADRQLSGDRSECDSHRRLRHGLFDDRPERSHQGSCSGNWLGRRGSGCSQHSALRSLCRTLPELGSCGAALSRAHSP